MSSKRAIIEENGNDSDDDDFKFTEIYINKPFYDWKMAQREYGLVFSIISEDGFDSFFQEKFLTDFITLRKCYIQRDYVGVRFWVHKFKGSFNNIDHGQTYEIENLYCNFVVRMEIFIEKIAEFSREINNPIKPEHLKKLRNDLDFCDSLEDKIAMEKILENRRQYLNGRMKFDDESLPASGMCSNCTIL